jgi:sialate O-acetylesterase
MHDNPNAWMVPAIDLGASVHPKNKWGYGNRAAEVAAQKVYAKEGVQAYGPTYQAHKIDGSLVTLQFSECGSGLVTRHSDKLQGFSVSGKDGKWHWAEANITSTNTVTLTCKEVPSPQHIRYAYAQKRTWANLFNKEGLPALSFTTVK